MKRILFEFGTNKKTVIGNDISDDEIEAYMKLNKHRIMYVWFNDKIIGDNI